MKSLLTAAVAVWGLFGCWAKTLVVFNEDSDHVLQTSALHANPARFTEEEFLRYVDDVIGPGGVSHFFMCVNARTANFTSKTESPYWTCLDDPAMAHPQWIQATKDFAVTQNKDHLALWLKRCRERGVSPWMSIRMNDVHCVYEPEFFANVGFWKAHPEFWLVPNVKYDTPNHDWCERALDYSRKEVRDHMLAFIAEVLERYDADGLEIDWMRFERHLPRGRERELSGCLDETMRAIRKLAEAAVKRRGHPVKIAARVDSDPVSAVNHGTNYRVWAKERLIDWLIPCNFFGTVDFELPYAKWSAEVKALNPDVVVIPGLDNGVAINGKRRALTADEYCGWGERMYAQGAPGAYFFNLFAFHTPHAAGVKPAKEQEQWQVVVHQGFTPDVVKAHAKSIPAGARRECANWLKQ